MRIAVLADAHGNQFGFFAALADAKRDQPDMIVAAGDILCAFPGGPEILRTLATENMLVVRGNAEDLMVDWSLAEPTSGLRASPRYLPIQTSCARFTDSDFEAIEQWPLTRVVADGAGAKRILFCHGTPKSKMHSIADFDSEPVRSHLENLAVDAVVAGHYHYHWSRLAKGTLLVLASSCGKPFAGGTNAQYLTLDIDRDSVAAQHKSVEYDQDGLVADLMRHDFAEHAGPIGWLELSDLFLARKIMPNYFRDKFDATRAADRSYLVSSVRSHLAENGALDLLESTFGRLG